MPVNITPSGWSRQPLDVGSMRRRSYASVVTPNAVRLGRALERGAGASTDRGGPRGLRAGVADEDGHAIDQAASRETAVGPRRPPRRTARTSRSASAARARAKVAVAQAARDGKRPLAPADVIALTRVGLALRT